MSTPQSLVPLTPKIYTWGTGVAAVLMTAALLWPPLAPYAVAGLAAVPVVAALWTAANAWQDDRPLSLAAILAVLGLVAVYFGRGLL